MPAPDTVGTRVAHIEASVSQPQAVLGTHVSVTAVATNEDGAAARGIRLRFDVKGSVTGDRVFYSTTGGDGKALLSLDTLHAEVVRVRVSSE